MKTLPRRSTSPTIRSVPGPPTCPTSKFDVPNARWLQVIPRLMILDPPFAIVMRRKDVPHPYFVALIANAGLLGGK